MYKDLPAIRGKYYIQRLIEEGEHEHQDFKYKISDACKIARSISAFSNNDGGRLLVGVKDNGVIAGIRSEEDVHVIEAAAEIYCRPAVRVEMTAFQCEGGLVVLRASIPRAEARPVECREEDGSWRAYYRVADENIAAHPLMVRTWRREYVEAADGLAFSADEGALLQSLESLGPVDVEQLILHTHLSRRSAEDMIVKLAEMGLVEFVYSHQRFMVITNA
ncbi:MAG: ATP-binding protein [Bacteroidales bacterium]|nr:ATP-binding protein [Bacteroidales bacterium]